MSNLVDEEKKSCQSDEELIAAARDGDDEAFRQLVRKHQSRVAATVIGMLGQCPEADDVGQETFIRFYNALGDFHGDSSVETYLTRIAINLSLFWRDVMDKKVTDLLYRSCQGALSDDEQKWLDGALAGSEELRKEKELIASFFKTARSSPALAFAPFFDDRVMKKIKARGNELRLLEPYLESLIYAFRRVAVAAVVAALLIVSHNLASSDAISLDNALGVPEVSLADAFDPFYPPIP